jgi:hypothetical protein
MTGAIRFCRCPRRAPPGTCPTCAPACCACATWPHGMCKEVTRRKAGAGPLLPLEGKMYLDAVHPAIAGVVEAAMGLEAALVRLEQPALVLDGRKG